MFLHLPERASSKARSNAVTFGSMHNNARKNNCSAQVAGFIVRKRTSPSIRRRNEPVTQRLGQQASSFVVPPQRWRSAVWPSPQRPSSAAPLVPKPGAHPAVTNAARTSASMSAGRYRSSLGLHRTPTDQSKRIEAPICTQRDRAASWFIGRMNVDTGIGELESLSRTSLMRPGHRQSPSSFIALNITRWGDAGLFSSRVVWRYDEVHEIAMKVLRCVLRSARMPAPNHEMEFYRDSSGAARRAEAMLAIGARTQWLNQK
jgi:hypothetical protein